MGCKLLYDKSVVATLKNRHIFVYNMSNTVIFSLPTINVSSKAKDLAWRLFGGAWEPEAIRHR